MNRWALHLYVCIRPYKRHMNWMLFAFASGADVFIAVIEFHLPFYYNFFLFLLPRSSNNSRMRMVSWIHDEPAIWILPHGQVRHKHYDQTLKHRLNNNKKRRKSSENSNCDANSFRIQIWFGQIFNDHRTEMLAMLRRKSLTRHHSNLSINEIRLYNWFGMAMFSASLQLKTFWCFCVLLLCFGSFVWNDQFIPNTDVH